MTTQTLTLTDFLLARIAEDEAGARRTNVYLSPEMNTSRVLAECAAKRRIINDKIACAAYVTNVDPEDDLMRQWIRAIDFALRALAVPYATHPDYREEWPG